MKIGILFISFFIQITAAPRPYFLLIFPKVIPADGATKTCIHLSYLNESLSLTLTLQTKKNTIKLLQEFVVDTDWHRCISLQDTIQNIDIAEEANLNLTGGSDSYRFEKIKKIYLEKKKKNGTFIQTDKPVYKPGQTVKFRTVTLNEHFIPDLSQIPLVIIQDPQKNRISQWLNVTTQHGIGDFSFPLANEPLQGEYTIQIHKAGSLTYHSFTVEEYVLPKHEVQLKLPRAISVMDKEFTVTMCARYTYGKPVLGTAVFRICRKSQYFWQKINSHEMTNDYCKEFNGTTDISGCVSKVIYTNYFHLRTPVFKMEFIVEAKLIEKDTDQELTATGKISVSTQISKVTFEDVQDNYKTGIPFTGKVCVEGADGSPLSGVNVIIQSRQDLSEILSTNERGQAYFSLNTSAWNNQVISLSAYQEGVPRNRQTLFGKIEPYSEAASLTVSPQFSKSKSFLRIQSSVTSIVQCDKDFEIHVDYIFNRKALEGSPGNMVFLYLVMEGRRIVLDGQKQSNIGPSGSLEGTLSITVSLGADAAPKAKVLVYVILPNGELIADNREFTVSKCFRNKVKLQFMEPEVSPATETSLHLNAAAGSLCALRVVDKSVLLLKPEQELSIDKVYSTAKQEVADVHALQKEPPICRPPNPQAVANRTYTQIPPSVSNEMDVYRIIWDMGLDVSTDTSMRKPIFCSLKFTDTVSQMYDIPYMWTSHAFPGAAAVRVMKQQANADRLIGLRHQTDLAKGQLPSIVLNGFFRRVMLEETVIGDILEEVTPVVEKIRKYFPETWIWDLISVGSSGDVFVPVNVPDTITEWKAGMFCMANTGFGLAKTVGLNVFQPFFLEPILPYSVIRGEEFPLKVTVFNYLQQCIKVQVTLEKSEDFEISSCERCEYSSCICGGRAKAFVWNIVPITLGNVNFTITAEAIQTNELCYNEVVIVPTRGRKDTVIKPLLVEPEGTKMEMAKSSLLCPKGPTLLENISVQLPSEVVKGSARAYVSVVGDIMGNALQNLDNLLAMPYGCGEQNMVLFAPNIFILQYLEKTGQLTAAIKEKAIRFLESGYQRELLYKHNDGSYSAFGHIDPTGNTWLTAFVLKSFAQAKPYIFVDDTHINNAAGWLRRLQLQSGCFRSVGHLFHSSMKGGVNDDISLAAYIVAALLELQTEHPGNIVTKGLKCLCAAAPNITNPYTLAVTAYTYSLAGRMKERRILLNHLYSIAIEKDDTLHWEEAKKAKKIYNPYIWYQAPSTEVEMAAYVLLALVSVPNPSSDDIISASKIVKWITKQQGPHGGFSSTQDTVVALQALSKYGGLTYSEKGHITIKIKSKENLVGHFEVNKDNRLLLQRIALTDIPRNYTAEINGEGCILFQTMLKYNIPPPKNVPVFSIQVETARSTCIESSMTRFEVLISVSYTGKRVVSNMAIIEVKMLSGYIPDKKSVQMLQQSSHLVKKTEVQTNHVLLYLEELSHNASKFAFYVEQEVVVKNLKPAVVKIYDYYEKDEHAITQYVDPCVAEAEKESNTR